MNMNLINVKNCGDFSGIALTVVFWQSPISKHQLKAGNSPLRAEVRWKIIHHWVSFPTQSDKFWDTAYRYTCVCTPVCRLCGRYLAILGRPIRITVPSVTVAPTVLVGSLIRSSNLPHSLQRGVPVPVPVPGVGPGRVGRGGGPVPSIDSRWRRRWPAASSVLARLPPNVRCSLKSAAAIEL